MADSRKQEDDRLPDKEATKRFERTVRRMVETPPKPHKPKDGDKSKKGGDRDRP